MDATSESSEADDHSDEDNEEEDDDEDDDDAADCRADNAVRTEDEVDGVKRESDDDDDDEDDDEPRAERDDMVWRLWGYMVCRPCQVQTWTCCAPSAGVGGRHADET